MTSVLVNVEEVFQAMLLKLDPFLDAIPSTDNPADHILWLSTFEEEFDDETYRPVAICTNAPFGAGRTTEGDLDQPLYNSGVFVEFQRNHADFDTDLPQVSRKAFKDWYGQMMDDMANWRRTDMQFLRFTNVIVAADPCRTPIAKRDTDDDFWSVGIHFEIDGGEQSS